MNNGLLEIFSYIILFIYTIFTIGNLYMILQKKTTERNFFNVFLMPLLALFYLLRFKNHNILIYLAIFSFWIGDILLTKKNKRNVILGLSLSCIGMIFYVITYNIYKNCKLKLFANNINNDIVFWTCIFWSYNILWICKWIFQERYNFSLYHCIFKCFTLHFSNTNGNFEL